MQRRSLLKGAAASAGFLLISKMFPIFAAEDTDINKKFMDISAWLTANTQLDPNIGKIFVKEKILNNEAALAEINEIYKKMNKKTNAIVKKMKALERDIVRFYDKLAKKPNGELSALERDIIMFWYMGVAKVGNKNKVVNYISGMDWSVLTFTKPQGVCGGEFGFWANPPASM